MTEKQNAQPAAQNAALAQDAEMRVNKAASSHKQRSRDVDRLMGELYSANEEHRALKAVYDEAAQRAKTPQEQVHDLEQQLAEAPTTHSAMDKQSAEIKGLKGLLGKP